MSKEKNIENNIVVVSAGDSLTQATFSSNYLSILSKKLKAQDYSVINSGKVGDTSANLLKRIDKDVLAHNPNFITILIGANDARQNIVIHQALQSYRKNMEEIISIIRNKTNVPIALISLAPLGENLYSEKNKTVERYNTILKNIASQQNLTYLPFFESLMPILIKKTPVDTSQFKLNLASVLIKSAFQKYILRRNWNEISDRNGYSVLTDGIHLNDTSGNILAGLIKDWLLAQDKH